MTTLDAVGDSFDFGRVVQRTFRVIGQNFGLFALSAILLVSAPSFIGTMLGLKSRLAGEYFSAGVIGGAIVAAFGSLLLQSLVVHTVVERMNGRAVGFGDALGVAARFALPLLGLGIVQGLGVLIGLLLLIVPGLILSVMWSVSTPCLIVEKRGIFASLQRSRDLTRGHRWSIVGIFLVYFVLSMILGIVVGVLGAAAGFGGAMAFSGTVSAAVTPVVVISTFLSSLVNAAQYVLLAAGAASIYYELRTTKEGVAPDQLASVFD